MDKWVKLTSTPKNLTINWHIEHGVRKPVISPNTLLSRHFFGIRNSQAELVILNKFSAHELKETYKSVKGNMLLTVELTDFRIGSDHRTLTSSPAR